MTERKEILKYEVKGMLTNYVDGSIEVMDKKENVDTLDFERLVADVKDFCENNMEENVVVTFTATSVKE